MRDPHMLLLGLRGPSRRVFINLFFLSKTRHSFGI